MVTGVAAVLPMMGDGMVRASVVETPVSPAWPKWYYAA